MSWVAVFDVVWIFIVVPVMLVIMRDWRNGKPFRLDVWLDRWSGMGALPEDARTLQ